MGTELAMATPLMEAMADITECEKLMRKQW